MLALILMLSGFVATSASAQFSDYASAWTGSGTDWFPLPPGSPNPLGPPNATCVGTTNAPTVWAQFSFPSLGIPGGDTVVGIEVNVNYGSVIAPSMQLYLSGSPTGSTRTLPATPQINTCGGSVIRTAGGMADLWGTSLTPADFNSAGTVQVRLTRTTAGPDNPVSIDIESIQLVVYTSSGSNNDPDCSGAAIADQIADNSCQATISGSDVTGITDSDGDPLTITVNPTTLALGANSVNVMADDGNGGTCSTDINVNVIDVTDPVIACPANVTLNADASCQATYTTPPATAMDNCGATVTAAPALPALFSGVGGNTITYTATDAAGNAVMCDQTVTVQDVTPPTITLNGADPLTLECGIDGYVEPGATAADNCDGAVPVTPSGMVDTGIKGLYMIDYTATDAAGNGSVETRDVNVVDTTPPVVTLNGSAMLTLECGIDSYTELGATAVDACDGSLPAPPSGMVDTGEPGTYMVDYTATDSEGLSDTETRTIDVNDTIAPVINLNSDASLWPPNHKYKSFSVAGMVDSIDEACADLGVDDIVIAGATSDEVENGPGDGNTVNDIVIAGDCSSVDLRSERQGGGDGRVYEVGLEANDGFQIGGSTYNVSVPHSKKSTAIDSGDAYGVAGCTPAPPARALAMSPTATEEVKGLAEPEEDAEDTVTETPAVEAKAETAPSERLDVAVEELPDAFALVGNYPNPFNPTTQIRFAVPEAAHVKLAVFDMLGRQVRVLIDGVRKAGTHEATFDAATLPSGTYLYRLDTPQGAFVGSMLLVK